MNQALDPKSGFGTVTGREWYAKRLALRMSYGTLVGSLNNIVRDSDAAEVSGSSKRGRFLTNNVFMGRICTRASK